MILIVANDENIYSGVEVYLAHNCFFEFFIITLFYFYQFDKYFDKRRWSEKFETTSLFLGHRYRSNLVNVKRFDVTWG